LWQAGKYGRVTVKWAAECRATEPFAPRAQ
jgi:hypothetical protein